MEILSELKNSEDKISVKAELSDIDCIKTALATLEYEEYANLKNRIDLELDSLKSETLRKLKNSLEEKDYLKTKDTIFYLERSNEIEGIENTLIEFIFGEREDIPTTQTELQINEFKRYLFIFNRQLKEFEDSYSLFNKISDSPLLLLTQVFQKVMRRDVVKPTRELLKETLSRDKEFFLVYYDVFRIKFEEFKDKCSRDENIWGVVESLNEVFREVENDY